MSLAYETEHSAGDLRLTRRGSVFTYVDKYRAENFKKDQSVLCLSFTDVLITIIHTHGHACLSLNKKCLWERENKALQPNSVCAAHPYL